MAFSSLKMTVNLRRAIDLNVNASLEFLKIAMPDTKSWTNRGTSGHLLDVLTLDELPEDNKPRDEKWIAMRLRIPHELGLRLTPRILRRHVDLEENQGVWKDAT